MTTRRPLSVMDPSPALATPRAVALAAPQAPRACAQGGAHGRNVRVKDASGLVARRDVARATSSLENHVKEGDGVGSVPASPCFSSPIVPNTAMRQQGRRNVVRVAVHGASASLHPRGGDSPRRPLHLNPIMTGAVRRSAAVPSPPRAKKDAAGGRTGHDAYGAPVSIDCRTAARPNLIHASVVAL